MKTKYMLRNALLASIGLIAASCASNPIPQSSPQVAVRSSVIQVRPVEGTVRNCSGLRAEPKADSAVAAQDLDGKCLSLGPSMLSLNQFGVTVLQVQGGPDWVIELKLQGSNLRRMNSQLEREFHRRIAFLLGGRVLSSPMVAEQSLAQGELIVAITSESVAADIAGELE